MQSFLRLIAVASLFLLGARVQAADVQLLSASLLPASPCPGQVATLQLQVRNNNGFMAGVGRVMAAIELSATHPGCSPFAAAPEIDKWWVVNASSSLINPITPTYVFGNDGGYSLNLAMGETRVVNFPVSIPALAYAGAYKVHVGLDDFYVTEFAAIHSCTSFSACVPAPAAQVFGRVEGQATNGQSQLLWLDYSLANQVGNQARLQVPACFSMTLAAPTSQGPATIVGNTVTWDLPDAGAPEGYSASGSLWVQVQLSGCAGLTSWTPTLSAGGGAFEPGNTVSQAVGAGGVGMSKLQLNGSGQPVTSLAQGELVTYVLQYNATGSGLSCFDSFDGPPADATYNPPLAPVGWSHPAVYPGSWQTWADPQGGQSLRYLNSPAVYSQLRLDCPAAQVNGEDICGGVLMVADVMIEGNAANGDVGIILRGDGQTPGRSYQVTLSVDPNPAGNLMLQKLNSGSVTWPVSVNHMPNGPQRGAWYTLKALEQPIGSFYAKYWRRGQPEPSGWQLVYTDPSPLTCGSAGDGIVWRPALAGLNDLMSFDNVRLFNAGAVSGLRVWDSVPAGIDFISAQPSANGAVPAGNGVNEGLLRWDFTGNNHGAVAGVFYGGSGSFTWTGLVDCLEGGAPAVNTALIQANGVPAAASNSTSLTLGCATTPSATATTTATPTLTVTVTPSRTACVGCSPTSTRTPYMYTNITVDPNVGSSGTFVTITTLVYMSPAVAFYFDGLPLAIQTIGVGYVTGFVPNHAAGTVADVRIADPEVWHWNDTLVDGFTYVGGGSATVTATRTQTTGGSTHTVTPTPIFTPGPYPNTLVISVFDSFGAQVWSIYSGMASAVPSSLTLSASAFMAGGQSVNLSLDTLLSPPQALAWDGSAQGGGFVAPGTYTIRVSTTDIWGAETVIIEPVTVTAVATATPGGSATVTQTLSPTTTIPVPMYTFGTATPTPAGTVTPLACSGAGVLANADMEDAVVLGIGLGAFLGTWHISGAMAPGAGRFGSQALQLVSAGGYMGFTSEGLQDFCVDTTCTGSFCVWTEGHGGYILLQQLDAGGNLLAQRYQFVVESPAWQQSCATVGDGAFPWMPGAVALRARLQPRLMWSTFSDTRFDDASYSTGVCGTPTVTPSASPTSTVCAGCTSTYTPTNSSTRTGSPTPTPTFTRTATPTLTVTRTVTASVTPTFTLTATSVPGPLLLDAENGPFTWGHYSHWGYPVWSEASPGSTATYAPSTATAGGSPLPGGTAAYSYCQGGSLLSGGAAFISTEFVSGGLNLPLTVGSGVDLGPLSPDKSLSFSFKADQPGLIYWVQLWTSGVQDNDFYAWSFSPADTDWHRYTVFFPDGAGTPKFAQPGNTSPQPWSVEVTQATGFVITAMNTTAGPLPYGFCLDDVRFGPEPTAGPTATFSPIFSPTPSPSPMGMATATPTRTPNSALTATFTITWVPTIALYDIEAGVYDSFGTEVQPLYTGQSYGAPVSLSLSAAAFVAGTEQVSADLGVPLNPSQALVWNGSVSSGLAEPGIYYVIVRLTDEWGGQTVLTEQVEVLADPLATVTATPSPSPNPLPACVAPDNLGDPGFEGYAYALYDPQGGPYQDAWTAIYSSGAAPVGLTGLARSGSQGGFAGHSDGPAWSIGMVQDLCVTQTCPLQICVWLNSQSGGVLVLRQLDGNLAELGSLDSPTAGIGSWQQVCLTVGDGAFPYQPGLQRLRVIVRGALGLGSGVSVDDASVEQLCGGATVTPTLTVSPTRTPSFVESMTFSATRTPSPVASPTALITDLGFSWTPAQLTVSAGTLVTWSWLGTHDVNSDTGLFSSGAAVTGGSFNFTFNTPGTYRYHCSLHGAPGGIGMSGIIYVLGGTTPTSTSTRTSTPSATRTATPSRTPTNLPTATATTTATPCGICSPTASATVTPTSTISGTGTATPTACGACTPTLTRTPSPTWTAGAISATRTSTPTFTPSLTVTPTRTPCAACTATQTFTPTSTRSATRTASPTRSSTVTPTHTPTSSITRTPTGSPTVTSTPCAACVATATPTISLTPTTQPACTPWPTPGCMYAQNYAPVCGCDGVTYTNSSHAACMGIGSYSNGPCGGAQPTLVPTLPPPPGDEPDSYPYPNPAGSLVQIAVQVDAPAQATVTVLNGRGLTVTLLNARAQPGLNSISLDLQNFARGVYYYQVRLNYDDGRILDLPVKTFMVDP